MSILSQQFNQRRQSPSNPLANQVQRFAETNPIAQRIKSLGSPKNAYDYLLNNNMTIKGPNGQQMNIRDFCSKMGVNPDNLR